MWLNRHLTKEKTEVAELAELLSDFFELDSTGLQGWIKERFIEKFYGPDPHPFVLAMQQPERSTLLGYVVEHQHFLRQWVRSCARIIANSDSVDVYKYEIENINTEFGGFGTDQPSHYELLLKMGESLGLDRSEVLETPPLPATSEAMDLWDEICAQGHWTEAMAAMHSLELVASRKLKEEGASMHYFDPAILESDDYTEETKAFLREGYEADVGHSEEALDLVAEHASHPGLVEAVQSTFLRSIEAFDRYLMARLQRAEDFEDD